MKMGSFTACLKFQNPEIFCIEIIPDILKEGVKLFFYISTVLRYVLMIGKTVLRFEVIGRIENPKAQALFSAIRERGYFRAQAARLPWPSEILQYF